MVMPGDNVTLTVELIQPIAMDKGLKLPSARWPHGGCRKCGHIIA